jgi:DNA polymerase III alpha subunit
MIPIFTSHYSIGRSVLKISSPGEKSQKGIFDLAAEFECNEPVIIVDDNPSGFVEAFKASKAYEKMLVFGIRFKINRENSDESYNVIVFANGDEGFKKLSDIYTRHNFEIGDDFIFRAVLNNSDSLSLAFPFYSSFIAENFLHGKKCVPDPIIRDIPFFLFVEDNGLPFDGLLGKKVEKLAGSFGAGVTIGFSKSIYYENKRDVSAYMTHKILCNRSSGWKKSSLSNPNLEWFGSDEFCFESYLEGMDKKKGKYE